LDKNATIENLLTEIDKKSIFSAERGYDLEVLNTAACLRVTMLEKKKDKLVGRAANDVSVSTLMAKHRFRLEFIPTIYESDPANEADRVKSRTHSNNKFVTICCFHACRDGELFSNPFLVFSKVPSYKKKIIQIEIQQYRRPQTNYL
jgi:hypothetical protein